MIEMKNYGKKMRIVLRLVRGRRKRRRRRRREEMKRKKRRGRRKEYGFFLKFR